MMRHTSVILASLSLVALTACGGNVQSEGGTTSSGSTGSSTSSSGSTGTSTSSSGSTGTSTSSSGSTSTSTSSSSSSGGACTGSVTLVVDNGALLHLGSDCASDTWNPTMVTTPSGYLLEGGVGPGLSTLSVFGCMGGAPSSAGIALSVPSVMGPGTFTSQGVATYTDQGGVAWTNLGPFQVVVSKLGGVGDTIEGTFITTVGHPPSQIAQSITGSFTVCHVPDEQVP